VLYMLLKAPPKWAKSGSAPAFLLVTTGAAMHEGGLLWRIALFFGEAGAFVFGSGLAIVPFLHDAVTEQGWLTEQQFIDAVAVAMITPGPVVITVGFIGYLVAGFPGACVAAAATFLPCYLLTVLPAPYVKRFTKNASVRAFVDGITSSVVGALVGAVVVIAMRSINDLPQILIAITSLGALLYWKKLKEPTVIACAAALGLILKTVV
jgi:chromate transporter